jgi:hypothetical protein
VLHLDVAKVDRDAAHFAYIASVSNECCTLLFKMFHLFQTYVCKHFDLDVAYVSHICCTSIFQMFQSYVTTSVFMLQVISVLSRSCICCNGYAHILQVYISTVFISMLQVFYLVVAYVIVEIHICYKRMFLNALSVFRRMLQQVLHVQSVFISRHGKGAQADEVPACMPSSMTYVGAQQ